MPGMKVAISLPDPVFRAAETLARKLRKSRSQLYAEAIAEYVGKRGAKAVTGKLEYRVREGAFRRRSGAQARPARALEP